MNNDNSTSRIFFYNLYNYIKFLDNSIMNKIIMIKYTGLWKPLYNSVYNKTVGQDTSSLVKRII